ncbi:hypothetical protein GH714_040501 [Hevea brasiliensis]|uniref:Pentacotripeptide-repeat region of PRORP domain-containing protein n=1 Tax=Hevea brasiliensis TaxID=3981 RepID=A0A6A6MGA1_HEVBR|nr:hypothetical protein GH714_040501 [Hevea brasiliensis]
MFEEARKILDVVKEQGVAPDVFCYNTFIIGLCKAGKMEEARTYLVEMVKNGLKPNVYTYGPFIHGYCKAGDMQGAESCIAEMLSCGIAPDDVVYGALIDGISSNCCLLGTDRGTKRRGKERVKQRLRDCEVDLILSFASGEDGDGSVIITTWCVGRDLQMCQLKQWLRIQPARK